MVIFLKRNKLSKIFIIIIVLLLIHGASYFISFLKYNNKNVVETSVLKEENNNLKKKINELEKALKLKETNNEYIISKVITRDIYNFYNEIIIDSSKDEINIGDAVVNESGLIGIVSKVSEKKAYVSLLTSDYNISVKINETYGNLNNNKITGINKYSNIKVGDLVYTSGLTQTKGNIYNDTITEIKEKNLELEATITTIDNNTINYVAIIKGDK